MRLYRFLDRFFPHSFAAKIFFVAFLGTHLPLMAVVGWIISGPRGLPLFSAEVGVIFLATLIGTAVTLVSIWTLLAPVRQIEADLMSFEAQGISRDGANSSMDDIGRLSRTARDLARSLSVRLEIARDEAQVDPLTSALNRRGFFELVDKAAPGEAALLYLDLDRFKELNDTQGHLAGDRMLTRTANAMRRVTREGDLVARLGGDEFVLVLPNADPGLASDIAHRIREQVMQAASALDSNVTASIGVTFRSEQESWPDAVDRADHAMLSAKSSGRNRSKLAG